MEVIENNLHIIIYRFKSYTAKNANIFILIVLAEGKKEIFPDEQAFFDCLVYQLFDYSCFKARLSSLYLF